MAFFSGTESKGGVMHARFSAAGHGVECPHCGNDLFAERRAQLNTAAMSLFNLDWANKSATALICSRCSALSWFLEAPTRVG